MEEDQKGAFDPVELVAGWGSGFISIFMTYPLYKVIFRQMLEGVKFAKAVEGLRREGFWLLYRGVLPPLCQKTVSVSMMFTSYGYYRRHLLATFPHIRDDVNRVFAASLAGVSEGILCPFERIQTLLGNKEFNQKFKHTWHTFAHIRTKYGFTEFYRGTSCIVFRNVMGNILFFTAKEKLGERANQDSLRIHHRLIFDFITGGIVGATISTAYYPLNVVKVRLQTTLGGPFTSSIQALRTIYGERGGVLAIYRGAHINFQRSLLSWGLINASYEMLKNLLSNLH